MILFIPNNKFNNNHLILVILKIVCKTDHNNKPIDIWWVRHENIENNILNRYEIQHSSLWIWR